MKKLKWVICTCCEGNGRVENPAFESGFTSSQWGEMHEDEQQAYMQGGYDVICGECAGSGKVQVPDVSAMTFGERRQHILERREAEEIARADAAIAAEAADELAFGC